MHVAEGEGKRWASWSLWGLVYATDKRSPQSPHSVRSSPRPGPGLWALHGECRVGRPAQQGHAGRSVPSLALRTKVGRACGLCDGRPRKRSTGLRGLWCLRGSPRNARAFRSQLGDVPFEWRCAHWCSLAAFSAVSKIKCTFLGIVAFELGLPPPTPTPFSFSKSLGCNAARTRTPHAACVALCCTDRLLSLTHQL